MSYVLSDTPRTRNRSALPRTRRHALPPPRLGALGWSFPSWNDIVSGTGSRLVKNVRIRTQISPEVNINPFGPTEGQKPSLLMSLIKPEIVVELTTSEPIVIAPYGTPTKNYMPAMVVVGGGIALGAIVALSNVLGGARAARGVETKELFK